MRVRASPNGLRRPFPLRGRDTPPGYAALHPPAIVARALCRAVPSVSPGGVLCLLLLLPLLRCRCCRLVFRSLAFRARVRCRRAGFPLWRPLSLRSCLRVVASRSAVRRGLTRRCGRRLLGPLCFGRLPSVAGVVRSRAGRRPSCAPSLRLALVRVWLCSRRRPARSGWCRLPARRRASAGWGLAAGRLRRSRSAAACRLWCSRRAAASRCLRGRAARGRLLPASGCSPVRGAGRLLPCRPCCRFSLRVRWSVAVVGRGVVPRPFFVSPWGCAVSVARCRCGVPVGSSACRCGRCFSAVASLLPRGASAVVASSRRAPAGLVAVCSFAAWPAAAAFARRAPALFGVVSPVVRRAGPAWVVSVPVSSRF